MGNVTGVERANEAVSDAAWWSSLASERASERLARRLRERRIAWVRDLAGREAEARVAVALGAKVGK